MRVLVVEDSPRLQRALKSGLGRAGYAVDLAGAGEEGLWMAQQHEYDVIILDRSRLDRELAALLLGLTLGGLVLLALIALLVRWTVRHSLRPIGQLADHVTAIKADNLGRQFPESALPRELRPVGAQLN